MNGQYGMDISEIFQLTEENLQANAYKFFCRATGAKAERFPTVANIRLGTVLGHIAYAPKDAKPLEIMVALNPMFNILFSSQSSSWYKWDLGDNYSLNSQPIATLDEFLGRIMADIRIASEIYSDWVYDMHKKQFIYYCPWPVAKRRARRETVCVVGTRTSCAQRVIPSA